MVKLTGSTTITPTSQVTGSLSANGVSVSPTGSATAGGGSFTFPIANGFGNPKTYNGVLAHSGGLKFAKGSSSVTARRFVAVRFRGRGYVLAQVPGNLTIWTYARVRKISRWTWKRVRGGYIKKKYRRARISHPRASEVTRRYRSRRRTYVRTRKRYKRRYRVYVKRRRIVRVPVIRDALIPRAGSAGCHQLASYDHYRSLYRRAYPIVKRESGGAEVLIGETNSCTRARNWVEHMLCMQPAVGDCSTLTADGFAHHPYQFDTACHQPAADGRTAGKGDPEGPHRRWDSHPLPTAGTPEDAPDEHHVVPEGMGLVFGFQIRKGGEVPLLVGSSDRRSSSLRRPRACVSRKQSSTKVARIPS